MRDGLFEGAPSISAIVAIPVCNERLHIQACLGALDRQVGLPAGSLGVLLLLNNCTDGTPNAIAAIAHTLSCELRVVVCDNPAASAGWARRRAMDAAADWLDATTGGGVLLTTDADSRVPADWVARNLAGIAAGADAVAGRLALDPNDAALLPPALHARGALEGEYEALLIEITARLDPTPGNPWPHHWCRSGASLATTLSTYRAIGGMPDLACGEDRAFVEAVLAHDRVVRQDPDIVVTTSGRLLGRARGGVADTIRQRIEAPESVCDERLEGLGRVVLRSLLRRRLRRLFDSGRLEALRRWMQVALAVHPEVACQIAGLTSFGAMHLALQGASPRLAFRPLRPSGLPRQIRRARLLVGAMKLAHRRSAAHRSLSVQHEVPALATSAPAVP